MGAFSESMLSVALNLITEFGNDCTLSKKITTDKVYNPITDAYDGTDSSVTISTKCSISDLEVGTSDREQNPAIRKVATVPYSTDLADLDATWRLDDNEIYKVDKVMSQNDVIIFKLYIG